MTTSDLPQDPGIFSELVNEINKCNNCKSNIFHPFFLLSETGKLIHYVSHKNIFS